jgi:hypothetical protein
MSPAIRCCRMRRVARIAVAWMLICAVPLQALAVGVAGVEGPRHTHSAQSQSLSQSLPLLDFDFRRALPDTPTPAVHTHAHGVFGDVLHLGSARHHHAAGDASVVRDADEAASTDSASTGASCSAFLAVLPPIVAALPAIDSDPPLDGAVDRIASRAPQPPERPPRASA